MNFFDREHERLEDIPDIDIEEKKKIINEIDGLDIPNTSIHEISVLISKLLTSYSQINRIFNPGLILHRGICYSMKPEKFDKIIYPPKEFAKMNRANEEGEQMFYCSSSKKGASRFLPDMKKNVVVRTERNVEANKLISDFIARKFSVKVLPENNYYYYKLTVAIAKIFFGNFGLVKRPLFDAIFYPTIQLNADEDNFVLRKEIIDEETLELEKVEFIEIISIENNICL